MILFWIKESFKLIGRAKSSFFLSLLSMCISVMLIALSLLSVEVSHYYQKDLKRHLNINIFIKDGASKKDLASLGKFLKDSKYINTEKFISKEEAANIFVSETGEDFRKLLDYNPLPASYLVTLRPEFVSKTALNKIVALFSRQPGVDEVVFRHKFIYKLLDMIGGVQRYIFIFTGILILVSVYIVFSTVKLITKSKYGELETMKLVGAKLSTIKMPIILNAVFIGTVAGIITTVSISGAAYYLGKLSYLKRLFEMQSGLFLLMILLIGPVIGWIVSLFSLRKITLKI